MFSHCDPKHEPYKAGCLWGSRRGQHTAVWHRAGAGCGCGGTQIKGVVSAASMLEVLSCGSRPVQPGWITSTQRPWSFSRNQPCAGQSHAGAQCARPKLVFLLLATLPWLVSGIPGAVTMVVIVVVVRSVLVLCLFIFVLLCLYFP